MLVMARIWDTDEREKLNRKALRVQEKESLREGDKDSDAVVASCLICGDRDAKVCRRCRMVSVIGVEDVSKVKNICASTTLVLHSFCVRTGMGRSTYGNLFPG